MNDAPLLPSIRWLAHENARFIGQLRALSDADWTKPTFCPEWNAAQIVGHMTGGAISYAERIRAARRGEVILSLGAGTPEEFQACARRNLPKIRRHVSKRSNRLDREEPGRPPGAEIERLEPGDLDRKLWHRKGDTLVRTFPAQRLYEVALHGWDLENDPDAPLKTDSLDMLVEILESRLPLYFNPLGRNRAFGRIPFRDEQAGCRMGDVDIRRRGVGH